MFPAKSTTHRALILTVEPDGKVRKPSTQVRSVLRVSDGSSLPRPVVEALASGVEWVELDSDSFHVRFTVYDVIPDGGWLLVSEGASSTSERDAGIPGTEEMAYRAFFEQAPVGIVHLDGRGMITFENYALRQIVGERPEDAWLGHHVQEIPLLSNFLLPLVDVMLSAGTAFDGAETSHTRPDGEVRHLMIVGSPIRDADAAVVGGVLTVQDITKAKLAEELSLKARSSAEEASRMKSALIATISHELRTPAGTIYGYASMLEQELSEIGEATLGTGVALEFAEAIRTRSADLVRLVGDLTELSQLETGVVRIQAERIDVTEMLHECLDALGASKLPVPVEVDTCADIAVRADRIRLRHVLEKVVGNAIKFTSSGRIVIRCSRMDQTIQIEVADTGVGIHSEALDLVFDPFSQEDDPMSRRFEGAGIGLSIVRRLIELMDGLIEIESEMGSGTTVRIQLPEAAVSGSDVDR
jgi:PAS domain S-box-containing protein